jgi:hypothetical protein
MIICKYRGWRKLGTGQDTIEDEHRQYRHDMAKAV